MVGTEIDDAVVTTRLKSAPPADEQPQAYQSTRLRPMLSTVRPRL